MACPVNACPVNACPVNAWKIHELPAQERPAPAPCRRSVVRQSLEQRLHHGVGLVDDGPAVPTAR